MTVNNRLYQLKVDVGTMLINTVKIIELTFRALALRQNRMSEFLHHSSKRQLNKIFTVFKIPTSLSVDTSHCFTHYVFLL